MKWICDVCSTVWFSQRASKCNIDGKKNSYANNTADEEDQDSESQISELQCHRENQMMYASNDVVKYSVLKMLVLIQFSWKLFMISFYVQERALRFNLYSRQTQVQRCSTNYLTSNSSNVSRLWKTMKDWKPVTDLRTSKRQEEEIQSGILD